MFTSIRSRLVLSFAGIALVAAFALGAVLLAILRNYYLGQELNYLRGNAQSVSTVVAAIMSVHAPPDEVQPQIENLAFLTQTRLRVYGTDRQLLYDSGSPQDVTVSFGVLKQTFLQSEAALPKELTFFSVGSSQSAPVKPITPSVEAQGPTNVFVYHSVGAGGSAYGFELRLPGEASPVTARSSQTITARMRDPKTGENVGAIQLSDGPAYGSAILASVARGWVFASAIAVCLAALIGAYISRRISAPVLALTGVTARMTQGDLSSRADARSRDEFGQLARSFNAMAERVADTIHTLRRFVADAAHELNTPLTALQTNLELALSADEPERGESLAQAQAQAERLRALVVGLLSLSRLEGQNGTPQREAVNLVALAQALGETYASRAEQAGLAFELELPAAPLTTPGDPAQLRRALENLLDNAIKFTPSGGALRLRLRRSDGQAEFSVEDTGIGIPAEDRPLLFQRFHRGRNAAAFPGSGLGLAIVQAIVAAHGGAVTMAAAAEGTCFTVRLPSYPGR